MSGARSSSGGLEKLRVFVSVSVVVGLAACGASASVGERDGGGRDGELGPDPVSLTGFVRRDCGPADGPALRIGLWTGNKDENGACDPPADRETFQVYWWQGWSSSAWGVTPDDGSVQRCAPGGGACEAWQGKMRFERFAEDVEAVGTADLWACDARDCPSIFGRFDLVWCSPDPDPLLCG